MQNLLFHSEDCIYSSAPLALAIALYPGTLPRRVRNAGRHRAQKNTARAGGSVQNKWRGQAMRRHKLVKIGQVPAPETNKARQFVRLRPPTLAASRPARWSCRNCPAPQFGGLKFDRPYRRAGMWIAVVGRTDDERPR
jgi:hypothetical protein